MPLKNRKVQHLMMSRKFVMLEGLSFLIMPGAARWNIAAAVAITDMP